MNPEESGAAPGAIPAATTVGEKVLLRPPVAADADAFVDLMREDPAELLRWVSAADTVEKFLEYVDRAADPTRIVHLIGLRQTGEPIGVINLNEIVRGVFQSAYLGYYLGTPHHGRGYMTEALRLALGHAFGPLGLHRLEANIQPGNLRSIHLVRRAGFTREGFSRCYLKINGQWRDHERWAILREDFFAGVSDVDSR